MRASQVRIRTLMTGVGYAGASMAYFRWTRNVDAFADSSPPVLEIDLAVELWAAVTIYLLALWHYGPILWRRRCALRAEHLSAEQAANLRDFMLRWDLEIEEQIRDRRATDEANDRVLDLQGPAPGVGDCGGSWR